MNINKDLRSILCIWPIFVFCQFTSNLSAQSANFGTMPDISINKRLNEVWKVNLGIENRINHFDTNNINSNFSTNYGLTDISFLVSRKWKLNYSFNAGYLIRFEDSQRINRFIQQFTIVDRLYRYTFSHRFVTDQTFINTDNITYRLRYRFVFERALSGLKVDTKEWYLKVGNEVLTLYEDQLLDLEYRITPSIGYAISDASKIEFGIDTRFKSIVHNEFEFENWLTINWFFSF